MEVITLEENSLDKLNPGDRLIDAVIEAKSDPNKSFKIIRGDDTAEWQVGWDCYCVYNGTTCSSLEELIKYVAPGNREWMEKYLSPEDIAMWDKYYFLTYTGHSGQEAIDAIVAETGISDPIVKDHLHDMLHFMGMGSNQYPSAPAGIKHFILDPAISFHPGTEEFYSDQVQAASSILYNAVTKHYHLFSQERIDQATIESIALLTEEEQGRLQENLPDLITMIDTSMAGYPEIGPIKNERSTSTIGWNSETELADEDWARVRTALEAVIKQE
ncbi:MAG: hypothetical protein II008_17415 [Oscillospiraceae bacterium]|nr:hypothetical protein [Oscillospiraceae bacterium]